MSPSVGPGRSRGVVQALINSSGTSSSEALKGIFETIGKKTTSERLLCLYVVGGPEGRLKSWGGQLERDRLAHYQKNMQWSEMGSRCRFSGEWP